MCYLRILASVCVIWLHTCCMLTDSRERFGLSDRQYSFFMPAHQIMCWAVPAFLMITGTLMLGRRDISYRQCLSKYVRRIVLALLIFGMPVAVVKTIVSQRSPGPGVLLLGLRAFLNNQGFNHMWYLYTLLGIYLALPILQLAVPKMKKQDFQYLLSFLAVFDFILPTVKTVTGISTAFSMPLSWPLFYLFAGYYIHTWEPKVGRNVAPAVFAAAEIMVIAINRLDFHTKELTAYTSPLALILTLSLFQIFRQTEFRGKTEKIWKIDRLCFGVYLIHPAFITFAYRVMNTTPVSYSSYHIAAVGFFLAFTACSFIGSWLLNRIGPLKKYVL